MLVQSPVAGDARVLREAASLAAAGHEVHVLGRDVPDHVDAPPGVTVGSVSRARGLRPGQRTDQRTDQPVPAPARVARWLLLPEHRDLVERRWRRDTRLQALRAGPYDAVHAHDFNTLELGAELAAAWGVPYIYDTHEYWPGRPRVGRPAPLRAIRDRRRERKLGAGAATILTVGDGVARALREDYGWDHVRVVRNTFDIRGDFHLSDTPKAAVYAGRLGPYRELEVIAAATVAISLPVVLIGPADQTWLAGFHPGKAEVPALRAAGRG